MSRLADFEDALVTRLAATMVSGAPLFSAVRGASGGFRPLLRDALRRERMPAAYVAFIEEPTAAETVPARQGPRFSVLVAARTLRAESDPRHGSAGATGAFLLIDQVRSRLDAFEPDEGVVRALPVATRFVDADERVAVYELLYRLAPIAEEPLAPGAPLTLEAFVGPASDDVGLAWERPEEVVGTGPAEMYKLYRKRPGDADYVLQEAVPASALEKLLATQPTGETLMFRVSAVNAAGEGPTSNAVSILL